MKIIQNFNYEKNKSKLLLKAMSIKLKLNKTPVFDHLISPELTYTWYSAKKSF